MEDQCESECGWGCDCGATQDVLRCVAWALIKGGGAADAGKLLAPFAAVCRSWRLAASAPGLWRRMVEADSSSAKHAGARWGSDWWRKEYILVHAGWRFIKHLAPDEEDHTQDDTQHEEINNNIISTQKKRIIEEEVREFNNETEPVEDLTNNENEPIEVEDEYSNDNNYRRHLLKPINYGNHHEFTPEPPFGRGVSVSHAALTCDGRLLAVAAEDASVAVWECKDKVNERWREVWRVTEYRWSTAWSVLWSPDDLKLLVTGAVRGVARGEAAVRGAGGELWARAGVAPPAAVAWCGGNAFLALEPRLMAPGLSLTVVWIYSATQSVSDAEAEVAAPLFCLYNEAHTHYSHIVVMKMPKKENKRRSSPSQTVNNDENPDDDKVDDVIANKASDDEGSEVREMKNGEGLVRPKEYYRVLKDIEKASEIHYNFDKEDSEDEENSYVMVCAGGTKGSSERGVCSSLRSWRITRQKPKREKIGLKERREARQRAREQPVEEPELDEAAVRGMCKISDGEIRLQEAVRGLKETPGAIWAITAKGIATCISVRASGNMRLLAQLMTPPHVTPPFTDTSPYYIYPSISDRLLVSPCPCGCGGVLSWCVRSLSACELSPAPRAPRPPLAALLLPSNRGVTRMLVLLGCYIYIWQSRVPQIEYEKDD